MYLFNQLTPNANLQIALKTLVDLQIALKTMVDLQIALKTMVDLQIANLFIILFP